MSGQQGLLTAWQCWCRKESRQYKLLVPGAPERETLGPPGWGWGAQKGGSNVAQAVVLEWRRLTNFWTGGQATNSLVKSRGGGMVQKLLTIPEAFI